MAPSNTVQPAPPRISARDATFAVILVGDEAARFIVDEELLTYHSPYFRAALKGGFSAAGGAVRLQEADPVMFEVLVHWLYHARLPNEDDVPELFEPWARFDDSKTKLCDSLVRLCVLSDNYDVPALRRHCMDQLFVHYEDLHAGSPKLDTIVYAFKNASSNSPLCRFLIDYLCSCTDEEIWSEACESRQTAPPLTLLSRALQRYAKFTLGTLDPFESLVACDYHDHKDEDERKRCAVTKAASANHVAK